MRINIGTRSSLLALKQTDLVLDKLSIANPDLSFCVKKVSTKGDRISDVPLSRIGGNGLFIKEIEKKLLNGDIDIAVHSMKDIPTKIIDSLMIGGVLERQDPHDVLISKNRFDIFNLPQGLKLGTSSTRRKAQFLRLKKDLEIVNLRGNLNTRLKKLKHSDLDGIIVAKAGIKRLYPDGCYGFEENEIPFSLMLPAGGQGAIGIEIRRGDEKIGEIVGSVNNSVCHSEVLAERAFIRRFGVGCQVPIAVNAVLEKNTITIRGEVLSVEGGKMLRNKISGESNFEFLGKRLAEELIESGADKLLEEFI